MTGRVLLVTVALACLTVLGCTEDPPRGILAPDADGVSAGKTAAGGKPDMTPVVRITLPLPRANPAVVPPVFHVDWAASDAKSARTKSVRWIIVNTERFGGSYAATEEYIRSNPDAPEWFEWVRYNPRLDQGTSYSPPPMDSGTSHVFAVQACSPSGDVTELVNGENTVRLAVADYATGPVFKVFNRYIGTIVTSSPSTPAMTVDIPAGVPMTFSLRASAEAYGAIVSGYRYGWDVQDPDDDSQWPMAFVPFVSELEYAPPQSFGAGTHTFCAEVIDCWGYKSRVTVEANVLRADMNRPLLVVDDWVENSPGFESTLGAVPSDDEHDQFWLAMTAAVDGFDPNLDVIETGPGNVPPLDVLLAYKNIIWSASAAHNATTSSAINRIIRFTDPLQLPPPGPISANIVALYMAAGGRVLLCGEQIMTASINRQSFAPLAPAFPLIFRYELGGDQDGLYEDSDPGMRGIGEESFSYEDCCLNVLDIAYIASATLIRREGRDACPVNRIRPAPQSGQKDGLRTALPAMGRYDFPPLALRPEVAGPGRWYAEDRSGLNCDIYNPPYFGDVCAAYAEYGTRSCFEPIYGNGCLEVGSLIYNAPVAFWTSVHADRAPTGGGVAARSAVWGFHPVYFNPSEVAAALDIVLFDEWQLVRKPLVLGARVLPGSDGR